MNTDHIQKLIDDSPDRMLAETMLKTLNKLRFAGKGMVLSKSPMSSETKELFEVTVEEIEKALTTCNEIVEKKDNVES